MGMKAVIKMLSNVTLQMSSWSLCRTKSTWTRDGESTGHELDPAQVMNFGVELIRGLQNCQRNEVECNLHMGCKWYRVEVDETVRKKRWFSVKSFKS